MPSAMPPDSWDRIQSLFLQAADLPPEEQAHFLDSAEPGLRAEVESLLATDRKSPERLSSAIENEVALLFGASGSGPYDPQNLSGDRLGPWRAVREIGHGGMGVVYLATRDDDQYHKRVAIKVVRRGMETAEDLGRFRHERQILANLDHPYIARLLDGGTTTDGRPFLVMDYVEGVRWTSSAENTLSASGNDWGFFCGYARPWPTRIATWWCIAISSREIFS
jgi:eukaryotic-like serine/threonine-protein kinase